MRRRLAAKGRSTCALPLLNRMAANVMIYKYIVKNVAKQRGMTATFMKFVYAPYKCAVQYPR
jgi:hypothetical protein